MSESVDINWTDARIDNMRSAGDAVEHMTECTLATIEGMVTKDPPRIRELKRQVRIAQVGIEYLESQPDRWPKGRCHDVIEQNAAQVHDWAKQLREEWARSLETNRGTQCDD